MSDPISALKQFTPVAANREELIFAAGLASAPKASRFWKWTTLTLAFSQLLTLGLIVWHQQPQPTTSISPSPVPAILPEIVPETPVPPVVEEEPSTQPTPLNPYSYLALLHNDPVPIAPSENKFRPAVRSRPPLTAGSRQFD